MIRFSCPECGATIGKPDDDAGRSTMCPTCDAKLRVPPGERPASTPQAKSETTSSRSPKRGNPPAPDAQRKNPTRSPDRLHQRYFALRWIATGNLLMGVVCWAGAVAAPVFWFAVPDLYRSTPGFTACVWVFALLSLGMLYFAAGHAIMVFLDIEENTRRQAAWLQHRVDPALVILSEVHGRSA